MCNLSVLEQNFRDLKKKPIPEAMRSTVSPPQAALSNH